MNKVVTVEEAISHIKDNMTIMVAGFLGVGSAETLIDALVDKGVTGLTLICNDTSYADKNIGKLISNKMVKKVITSHIGTNKESIKQLNENELEVVFTPQGTLVEKIRMAGAGLGGFLTPTGVGTLIENDKEKIIVNDKEYLLELSLNADVALLKGEIVDTAGNIYYDKAAKNFNPLMAMAAETVIVEAEELVETGEINPNDVMTPGLFVDFIVKGAK